MDYMQEDPYASHRFPPHNDPYYSGGGGGHDGNYGNNTSFDYHSDQHSIQSDRNRGVSRRSTHDSSLFLSTSTLLILTDCNFMNVRCR